MALRWAMVANYLLAFDLVKKTSEESSIYLARCSISFYQHLNNTDNSQEPQHYSQLPQFRQWYSE